MPRVQGHGDLTTGQRDLGRDVLTGKRREGARAARSGRNKANAPRGKANRCRQCSSVGRCNPSAQAKRQVMPIFLAVRSRARSVKENPRGAAGMVGRSPRGKRCPPRHARMETDSTSKSAVRDHHGCALNRNIGRPAQPIDRHRDAARLAGAWATIVKQVARMERSAIRGRVCRALCSNDIQSGATRAEIR
jgi:hypothetical protein